MIFCILRDPKDYDDIKRKAALELRIAIPTQVMLVKNISSPRASTSTLAISCSR